MNIKLLCYSTCIARLERWVWSGWRRRMLLRCMTKCGGVPVTVLTRILHRRRQRERETQVIYTHRIWAAFGHLLKIESQIRGSIISDSRLDASLDMIWSTT